MRTTTKVTALLLLLVASACIALLAARPTEPKYAGQPLSFWVLRYRDQPLNSSGEHDAGDAIRTIGTNALPFLHRWAAYEPPYWWFKLFQDLPRSTMSPVFRLLGFQSRAERMDAAIYAFSAFPSNADEVIPELTRRMKTNPTAIEALARLGNQGLPPLLTAWANSTSQSERWWIEDAVAENLTPDVRNTNLVPMLLDTMSRKGGYFHMAASNILFRTAPDLATNTPSR